MTCSERTSGATLQIAHLVGRTPVPAPDAPEDLARRGQVAEHHAVEGHHRDLAPALEWK